MISTLYVLGFILLLTAGMMAVGNKNASIGQPQLPKCKK